MKLRIAIISLITYAGVCAGVGPAAAQDSGLAQAENHFNKAQGYFINGDYQEAADEFLAAYQARPLPPFLFNIGASYEKLAKEDPKNIEAWKNAIKYYKKYLKEEPKAKDRKSIKKRIKVLRSERKRIQAQVAAGQSTAKTQITTSDKVEQLTDVAIRGLVVIESEPTGAFIYLDDKKKGPLSQTPWSGTIEGEHTIYIERKGYKPREKRISPSPDKLIIMSFALAEEDYLGWIDITSNVPGANVYIDDKSVGAYRKTPFSGNLKPGKHKIWVSAEGYDEYFTEIEIFRGQTHKVEAKLKGAPVGYLNVRGEGVDSATIYLDGKVLCDRGPCRKAVRQGTHRVLVKRDGYKPFARTIEIQPKTETVMRTKLSKKPGRGDAVWAYLFTAAFGGGGYLLGLQGKKIHDELQDEINAGAPPPDPDDPRFQRGKLFTIGADAAYVLAGVTFLTAVYYTFRDKGQPSKGTIDVRAIALEPQVGPGYAGFGMEVNW